MDEMETGTIEKLTEELIKTATEAGLDISTETEEYRRAILTTPEKVDAIYRTVVRGAPASDELIVVAQNVVDVRFDSSKQWEDLNDAICGLANALERKKV